MVANSQRAQPSLLVVHKKEVATEELLPVTRQKFITVPLAHHPVLTVDNNTGQEVQKGVPWFITHCTEVNKQ